jgi:hypothetical protein
MNKETEAALQWIINNQSAHKMAYSMRHHPDDLTEWFARVFHAFDELQQECHSLKLIDFQAICRQLDFD